MSFYLVVALNHLNLENPALWHYFFLAVAYRENFFRPTNLIRPSAFQRQYRRDIYLHCLLPPRRYLTMIIQENGLDNIVLTDWNFFISSSLRTTKAIVGVITLPTDTIS